MSKTLKKNDPRIVVYPRNLGHFGSIRMSASLVYGSGAEAEKRMERDMDARLEEIMDDIKRHVDNVDSVHIEFDQAHVCEHCGSVWTEADSNYNGGCCDKDEQAHIAAAGAPQ